ncbi:MAG TPA: hypothetical protein VJP85_15540 [Candidatus Baltobacteraceae bacterium]|nr:hypothetical protein [Candidatus Baltobacteraceae bacterium]
MNVIFVDRILPDGHHVLVPKLQRPRTCRRADGVPKVCYPSRQAARAARTKHDVLYHCPNCDRYHLATDRRHSERTNAA